MAGTRTWQDVKSKPQESRGHGQGAPGLAVPRDQLLGHVGLHPSPRVCTQLPQQHPPTPGLVPGVPGPGRLLREPRLGAKPAASWLQPQPVRDLGQALCLSEPQFSGPGNGGITHLFPGHHLTTQAQAGEGGRRHRWGTAAAMTSSFLGGGCPQRRKQAPTRTEHLLCAGRGSLCSELRAAPEGALAHAPGILRERAGAGAGGHL